MESHLSNFTRLEPVLASLQVPFDPSVARDVMTEDNEVTIKLLYQLFVELSKRKDYGPKGSAVESPATKTGSSLSGSNTEV